MALDKNDLLSLVAANKPDNTTGLITPAKSRQVDEQVITASANLEDSTVQDFSGPITVQGNAVLTAPIANNNTYVMRNGEWVRQAFFLAASSASFTISGAPAAPSFLPIQDVIKSTGVEVVSLAEGSFRNISGRTIPEMVGTININPAGSNGIGKVVVIISERSTDGVTWTGNLSSIRKMNVSGTTAAFNTKLSFVTDWLDDEILRFRTYEIGGGSVDFVSESETILGQSFTGPSMAWELSES